jgi:putative NIF3 family GTP cyclohydrolase 1 type 2
MKLSSLYSLAVESGIEKDPRGKAILKKELPHPYADTRILHGSPDTNVKRILVGIDIDPAELVVADRLRQQGGLDLVISHHPEGKAWAVFYDVMRLQIDLLKSLGIPLKEATGLLKERMAEVERRVLPANHSRSVDVARLLDIPFMCMHTPADNHVYWFIQKLLREKKPKQLAGILRLLNDIPEYQIATTENNAPRIIAGSSKAATGKVYVEMTGGTEGSKKVYGKLYKLGVRTIICMHLSEEHFSEVKDKNINVIIAGHIASDNLGLNLLLDNIEKKAKEEFQVINCSGFRRVKR